MYYKQAGTDEQAGTGELTPAQYRQAELGYFGLLRRKGMSPQFIDRNGEDLFAQALYEYVRSIRAGKEIRKPVAWIVICAWSRTVRLLEQPNWRPRMVSTESVGEIAPDGTPAPEEEFLTEDRYRKIREAVEHLPEYQRELISRSYFEGESVREAARKLDWTTSKAQRAHEAAQRHLHRLLGVESTEELEIAAGLAAFLTFSSDGCARIPQLVGGFEAVVDALAHHLSHLGERGLDLVRRPFGHGGSGGASPAPGRAEALGDLGRRALTGAHQGPTSLAARTARRVSDLGRRIYLSGGVETSAAATDGGVRVAETCKAIAVVCVIGTGAIAGGSALIGAEPHHQPAPPEKRPVASSHKVMERPAPAGSESQLTSITVPAGPRARGTTAAASGSVPNSPDAVSSSKSRPSPAQRRTLDHESEESTVENTFEAGEIAAAEEEGRRDSGSSAAPTDAVATLSNSGQETEAATKPRSSPKVEAEEQQTRTQFQGGLP
jgi:RNA polymerase sigma factor (sigma-70 family)